MSDNAKSLKIGFIGTGNIGQPIVRNLLRNGWPVTVWNRTPARYADLVAAGAAAAATPRELAASTDVVIAMLMAPEHLDGLLDGPDGILAGVHSGSIFIDMATGPPRHAQWLAGRFAAKGVPALDTPVQGGVKAAEEGALTVAVGGERAAYERALPVLQSVGKLVVYVGAAGSGQLTKLAHQMICAVTLQGIAEAFAIAKRFGADQAALYDVLSAGLSASPLLKNNGRKIISGDFTPGRPLWMYEKDRTNLAGTIEGTGLETPFARDALDRMYAIMQNGGSDWDEMALYTLLIPESAPSKR
ncbi:MAG: NAD(P)-dependent oxidoreductase [Candidatus Lustribacter sp.]|jgi:2-hydroxy-3-oxopropionate reductase